MAHMDRDRRSGLNRTEGFWKDRAARIHGLWKEGTGDVRPANQPLVIQASMLGIMVRASGSFNLHACTWSCGSFRRSQAGILQNTWLGLQIKSQKLHDWPTDCSRAALGEFGPARNNAHIHPMLPDMSQGKHAYKSICT